MVIMEHNNIGACQGGVHIRSQDSRGVPATSVDELDEEDRAALGHRQVADLIHDEERRVGEGLEAAVEPPCGPGLLQGVDQIAQRAEVDLAPAFGCRSGQAHRQVCLADS